MAAPSIVARIDRTSSMENEPRTLNIQQIQFAREAALYVVKTRSVDEAFQIFTRGMEPVTRVAKFELGQAKEEYYSFKTTKHQLRDALSAPF